MSKTVKPSTQVVLLLVILIAAFALTLYYQFYQFPRTTTTEKKLIEPVPLIFSTDKDMAITTQNIVANVTFEGKTETYKFRHIDLYQIRLRNGKPIALVPRIDILNGMIDNLPQSPDTKEPVAAKVLKKAQEFDRLFLGAPGLTIDKEKTLALLEEQIKNSIGETEISVPLVTKEYLGKENYKTIMEEMGFNISIGSFKAVHEDSAEDEGRNINLKIASEKINGIIMPPGGKFDFDKVVGERSAANGFKNAGVISQGRTIQGLGGGICQVSTALYNAVLRAGLRVDERHNHSIYEGIEYAPRGLDSAIAWGYKNLRFTNSLDYQILILAKPGKGTVEVSIYAEEKPYEKIHLETRNEVKHPFKTETRKSNKLKSGEVKVVHPGVTGYTVETFRLITKNGETLEERLSKDRYLTYNRIEEVTD